MAGHDVPGHGKNWSISLVGNAPKPIPQGREDGPKSLGSFAGALRLVGVLSLPLAPARGNHFAADPAHEGRHVGVGVYFLLCLRHVVCLLYTFSFFW